MSEDLGGVLAGIRAVLADHERRLFPVNRRGLPGPDGRVERPDLGIVGDVWEVPGPSATAPGWTVMCLDADVDGNEYLYIHTPHSARGGEVGDTVLVRVAGARRLVAAILAATDRIEMRSATVVPLRHGDAVRPAGEVPGE